MLEGATIMVKKSGKGGSGKKRRVKLKELPSSERNLNAKKMKKVKGGITASTSTSPFSTQPVLTGQILYQNVNEPSGSKK